MDPDIEVARRAAVQHGAFAHGQALAAGMTGGMIRSRRRSRRWLALRPRVYAIAGSPDTWERKAMALALAGGPGLVISHEAAAALHRFPNWDRGPLEASVHRERRLRLRGARVHQVVRLDVADVTSVDGIPCTTYARTLIDCAARMSLGQLARALDDGLVRRTVSLVAVERALDGLSAGPDRRTHPIRLLVDERGSETTRGESAPEMRLFRELVAAGFPTPVQQHEVGAAGRRYRLDLAYPEVLVAIEYDGFDFHRARGVIERDRRRDRDLQADGWKVLRFTSESSTADLVAAVGPFVARTDVHPLPPPPAPTPAGLANRRA